MVRTYTLKKRAARQADTRRRIVEAAVDLHSSLGPSATTLSMIAERAGVQRHTLYAHFPDERSLYMACSGLAEERDPMPKAAAWCGITGREERLTTALSAIYDWFRRNASLMDCIMRDVEHHARTQEAVAIMITPVIADWHAVLGETLDAKQRALLRVALSYFTWRTLVRDGGLETGAAVGLMLQSINGAHSAGK